MVPDDTSTAFCQLPLIVLVFFFFACLLKILWTWAEGHDTQVFTDNIQELHFVLRPLWLTWETLRGWKLACRINEEYCKCLFIGKNQICLVWPTVTQGLSNSSILTCSSSPVKNWVSSLNDNSNWPVSLSCDELYHLTLLNPWSQKSLITVAWHKAK